MADFNSRYTGAEIEAAIAKTDNILNYREVWAGTPTVAGVELSGLPLNPGTNDRTGTYDVIMTRDSTPPESTPSNVYVSRLIILNEDAGSVGTAHVQASDVSVASQFAHYYGATDKKLHALEAKHIFADGSGSSTSLYIHRIYRLEKDI